VDYSDLRETPADDDAVALLRQAGASWPGENDAAGRAFDDELERRLGGLTPKGVEQLQGTLRRLRAAGRQIEAIDESA
jgi:hypothetical protein